MKFSLFVHMERISPEQSHRQLYQEMVDLCEMADKGGFHAIWTGEHHGMDFTIAPNPLINIADLARRTRNVRLGTGTVVVSNTGGVLRANVNAATIANAITLNVTGTLATQPNESVLLGTASAEGVPGA